MVKSIKKDLNKVNKVLHPNSRKTKKLHQKANRLITRQKAKKYHAMKDNMVGEKLEWFKDQLVPNVRRYTGQMCLNLINKYLCRFDQELEQITTVHEIGKNRKNRRFARREDIINFTVLHEKEEFETCGLEVPDLMNKQQLALLRSWNRELRFLQNFHLVRYTRSQLEENNDMLRPEDYLPANKNVEDNDAEMQEVEPQENASDGDEDASDGDEDEFDNETEKQKEEDSEWSDVPDEVEESEDTPKTSTIQKKKIVHAHKNKHTKLKSSKEKMIVDG